MAKLIVDLPRDWEAKVTQSEKGKQIEIEPSFVSGSSLAACLYLTSKGDGGMKRKVVIMLNGNTGWPETRRVQDQSARSCTFDLSPEEFAKKSKKEDGDDDDKPS
jgi:hypothetical protein